MSAFHAQPARRPSWLELGVAAVLLAAATLFATPTAAAQSALRESSASTAHQTEGVAAVGMTVADLDTSIEFYTRILGFEKVSETERAGEADERLLGVFGARIRIARLRLGEEFLELTQFLAPEGRPIPADSRSNDRWFQHIAIAVSDIDTAYKHLREHNVRHASSGPQTLPAWNVNAAGISAFYFRDPDGHVLEVIHFPTGKGDPRWQTPGSRLFLGIDHTAIVVADTDRSLAFYRDALGLRIAGASENYGVEQEHLNNVFGARLRITTLRAASGPGVELLEYLAPTDGRDAPRDEHANDLIHWQTTLLVPDVPGFATAARTAGGRWVSPGPVTYPEAPASGTGACLIRDPDGHALLLRSTAAHR